MFTVLFAYVAFFSLVLWLSEERLSSTFYPTSIGRCSRSVRVVVPKPITMYLDKVISTSERGITGNVNKREVDVVH